jgi:hypothetical protein
MLYEYHHMGIPTLERRPGERYVARFRMWVSGYETSAFRIQWHRYEEGCSLHPLIQTVAHVAFKVDDLEAAIQGREVLLGPYFPLEGFRVAFIKEGGAPVELIETELTEEEIVARAAGGSEFYAPTTS